MQILDNIIINAKTYFKLRQSIVTGSSSPIECLRNLTATTNTIQYSKVLGRILKVGVQILKQGVQGSNVHDLFNPAGPSRNPFFPRKTPTAVQFHAVDVVMLTIHLNHLFLSIERKRTILEI